MQVSEQVAVLAEEIRELKASLQRQGLAKDAVNQHKDVVEKVAALRALKSQLPSDDPARDEVIQAKAREEREEAQRQRQALMEQQQAELKAVELKAPRPLVQRKIFHLFAYAGSGDAFHYEPPPRFNTEQCGFGGGPQPHPSVYVTEKWDGTTMQATSSHIYKRIDLWGKRRGADPTQRYDLRLLAWRGADTGGEWRGLDFIDADVRVLQALERYLPLLARLDEGLCAYFEVVHTDINATFKHLPGFADMRVFDFSRGDSFLPFEETVRLAGHFDLPLVGWELHEVLDAKRLWAALREAANRSYATAAAPLEGFVVREAGGGERVAKARVENLPASKEGEEQEADGGRAAAAADGGGWAAPSADLRHLIDIGLPISACRQPSHILRSSWGRR